MAEKKTVAPVKIDEDPTTEVAVPEGAGAPAVRQTMEMGEASGDIGQSDIKFPTLRFIQKMSDNPDKLDEGTVTLDNTAIIGDAKNVARITILSIHKYYREVLPYGAGTMPQSFDTPEEAVANGFRIARTRADREAGVPIVEDAARAVVAIEQPEGAMDRSFPYEIEGKRFTVAMWWIQSSAYANAAKYIFSKMAFELRQSGLLKAVWSLTTNKINGKKGDYYVPAMTLLKEERSDEFVKQLKEEIKL
ncbi:MAG: hypothetical protein ACYTBJ_24475 [Planctomycetota bacterium]|jgi:hypothetical protein